MLPKKNRVPRKEFRNLFEAGKAYHSANLALRIKENADQAGARFAFSVSKKVAKGAAERNRLRRRGYSALRELLPAVRPSHSGVFSFKRPFSATFGRLKDEIRELLARAGAMSS